MIFLTVNTHLTSDVHPLAQHNTELLMFTHNLNTSHNFWVLLTCQIHWTTDVCSLFQCNTELLTFGSLVGHHPEPLCFPSNVFAGLQSVSIQNLCSLSLWRFLQDLRVYESRTSDPTDFSCWVTRLVSELLILVSLFAATRCSYLAFIFLFIFLNINIKKHKNIFLLTYFLKTKNIF